MTMNLIEFNRVPKISISDLIIEWCQGLIFINYSIVTKEQKHIEN